MKERPILMNGPMVRAILRGAKTQTRRVLSPEWYRCLGLELDLEVDDDRNQALIACPFGEPGDRLWVRETFAVESNYFIDSEDNYPPPFNDGRPIRRLSNDDAGEYWQQCHYRASDPDPDLVQGDHGPGVKWTPSIHMPRWASRINLSITRIAIERLQDINASDVIAEGIDPAPFQCPCESCSRASEVCTATQSSFVIDGFAPLWDSINGKRPGCSWTDNPWVWVVSFERVIEQRTEHRRAE